MQVSQPLEALQVFYGAMPLILVIVGFTLRTQRLLKKMSQRAEDKHA